MVNFILRSNTHQFLTINTIILFNVADQMDFLAIQEVHFPKLFRSLFRYISNYFHSALQPFFKVNHFYINHFLFKLIQADRFRIA